MIRERPVKAELLRVVVQMDPTPCEVVLDNAINAHTASRWGKEAAQRGHPPPTPSPHPLVFWSTCPGPIRRGVGTRLSQLLCHSGRNRACCVHNQRRRCKPEEAVRHQCLPPRTRR